MIKDLTNNQVKRLMDLLSKFINDPDIMMKIIEEVKTNIKED